MCCAYLLQFDQLAAKKAEVAALYQEKTRQNTEIRECVARKRKLRQVDTDVKSQIKKPKESIQSKLDEDAARLVANRAQLKALDG